MSLHTTLIALQAVIYWIFFVEYYSVFLFKGEIQVEGPHFSKVS